MKKVAVFLVLFSAFLLPATSAYQLYTVTNGVVGAVSYTDSLGKNIRAVYSLYNNLGENPSGTVTIYSLLGINQKDDLKEANRLMQDAYRNYWWERVTFTSNCQPLATESFTPSSCMMRYVASNYTYPPPPATGGVVYGVATGSTACAATLITIRP